MGLKRHCNGCDIDDRSARIRDVSFEVSTTTGDTPTKLGTERRHSGMLCDVCVGNVLSIIIEDTERELEQPAQLAMIDPERKKR